MTRPFIKGLDLAEKLYREAVRPLLARRFPDLVHSAALLGQGSDVLGYDTPQSTDHDWGPRLMLFLAEADHDAHRDEIDQVLRRQLPAKVHGYPTNFGRHDDGTAVMQAASGRAINHGVSILTVDHVFHDVLGFDPAGRIRAVDWVRVPENRLLMLTSGRVFHDGLARPEHLGSVDQFLDSTDAFRYLDRLDALYDPGKREN